MPTKMHTANIIFTDSILMADKHNIPTGKMHGNCRLLPDYIVWVPNTTAYKRWNCQFIRRANGCHLIPSNRFRDGFPVPSQFAASKLTHYSTMLHRHSDSSRPRQRLLLSGDVHQNPGPVTKYPCSVCTSKVTRRGVSYNGGQIHQIL